MDKNFKDLFNLSGKVAVVTGARRGMGRLHCLALADAGAKVVVSDIDKKDCEKVVEEIRERGGDAIAVQCDVSVKEEVLEMAKITKEQFSGVDILVNNAGVVDFKNFFDLEEEDWNRIMNINLKGFFLCTQAFAGIMKEGEGGSVINIGSVAMGQSGVALSNTVPYVASKGGVAGMTEALAIDLGQYNIRVNLIAPGIIESSSMNNKDESETQNAIKERLPLKRIGKPEDVSGAVIFLASDASSYITGAVINVDGGWLST